MRKAVPCYACAGYGYEFVCTDIDNTIGSLIRYSSVVCPTCEGFKCLWIEPVKPEEVTDGKTKSSSDQ